MNKLYITFFQCVVFLALSLNLSAKNEVFVKNNDSVNTAILQSFSKKLNQFEQQRIADSISKVKLEERLTLLKTNDRFEKEVLQNQLQELKEKEKNRLAQKKAQIDSLRHTAKGFPVIGFFNDTLILIYGRLGSFSAKERADAISKRINELASNFGFKPDSIRLEESDVSTDIVLEDKIIMSISESDALWNNSTRVELAEQYRNVIVSALLKYKSEISLVMLGKEIALALLVLLIIGLIIFYVGKLFKWTAKKIGEQEGRLIKGIKIQNYTLFDSKAQVEVVLRLNSILKWIIILLVIYIALPILFGIFPWTKNFAETLFGYILNPVKQIVSGLWDYLPNLITILVIIGAFRYALKGLYFLKSEIEKGDLKITGFYPDWANPTYQIIKVLVFAFMVVVIFPYLPGSNSAIFQGVSVFLGFLFTFSSAGSLSNIIAGLVLTYMRLFSIGDRVKIGDISGDVIEKSLLVTRIRTIKNEIISIPNSTVMNSHTINYSSDAPEKGLIIHTTVTIGYDVPWRDMHQVLIDAALKTNYILQEPIPFVLQISLDDFYVSYQINAYTREANKQAFIYSILHQNIQDLCNERGIEIMSPHYRSARDGNTTTIPSDYLPEDYKVPGFKVEMKKED
ncbi:mechanosensitive ion channel family protein [Aquipluma nitroreducens]|uniref:Mechanosensitive ion channel family protein n=1 Tax=Aquipluma nitroreducens TaxID=2010828 RepID=A0A5K7S7W3_9BACT|nr:mechanosensitive ion channel family protein [Aquipluma nitroreducens]BBE17414.1 mechanosensitive ion channel family protein [Aquipluma nitroreducens]